jgi:hypothetical protein
VDVWLMKIGEPLPIDGDVRLMRMGILARRLVRAGHDVTWWVAAFKHFQKTHRFDEDRVVELSENYRLRLIHTSGYRSNLSLARVRDHAAWTRKFTAQARSLEPPSIVLCSMPTPGAALAAARYGRARGVPVVIDIRDLWPDVFFEILPRALAWAARPLLWPMTRTTREACASATALFGITPSYL